MKMFIKIAGYVGLFLLVLVGPPILSDLKLLGQENVPEKIYWLGLIIGFALGMVHTQSEKRKEWEKFKAENKWERREPRN